MKIKLDKEENVLIVLCERKKANLKIIYKDIDTNEILEESLLEGFQIGKELDEPVILGEPLDEETLRAKTTIYRIDGEAYKDDVDAVKVCQRIHVSRSFGAFNPVTGW